MPERSWNQAPGATPRDCSALYAQARNVRNGDFSASRQQVLQQFAHRIRPEMLAPLIPEQAPAIATPKQEPSPNRWYAVQSVLYPNQTAIATGNSQRPPALAVFSAAGGVGKTCIVATLGRALAGLGEQGLLVDMSRSALLPFYFAAREVKPGVIRTFSPPVTPGNSNAPVRLLSLDVEQCSGVPSEPLFEELVHRTHGVSRVLVDVGVVHRGLPGPLRSLAPTMLVPILPDLSSLAGLASLEAAAGGSSEIFYVLNQFDASLPLHVDLRVMLQQQLGSRLLPLVLHRSPMVSEALAEGTTVIDYAPRSEVAEDYGELAAWLRSLAAPAAVPGEGMRWLER